MESQNHIIKSVEKLKFTNFFLDFGIHHKLRAFKFIFIKKQSTVALLAAGYQRPRRGKPFAPMNGVINSMEWRNCYETYECI
jgi:hypothetical protein